MTIGYFSKKYLGTHLIKLSVHGRYQVTLQRDIWKNQNIVVKQNQMRKNLVYLEKGCYFFLSVLKKSFFGLPFAPVFSLTELSLKFEGLNPFFRKPQEYQILLQTSLKRSRPFKTKRYTDFTSVPRVQTLLGMSSSVGYQFTQRSSDTEDLIRGLNWLTRHISGFLCH